MPGHASSHHLRTQDHLTTCIYHVDPASVQDTALIDELTGWLDPAEKARMARFVQARHRHAFLVSHALTRQALGRALGVHPKTLRFETSDRGKPILQNLDPNWPWHFNVSHTEGMAAVAIDCCPVGLDVEWLDRSGMDIEIADRYFTRHEHQDILAAHPTARTRRFLTYWTLKEAYLKAEGWGIVDGLDTFEFHLQRDESTDRLERITLNVVDPIANPSQAWFFWHSQAGQSHLLSLAVALDAVRPHATVRCLAWQPQDWGF